MHTPNKSNPRKTIPTQKGTKHSTLYTVCKTNQPKSREGRRAHDARQKQKWSAERYALNAEGDKRHTGSRASNARRNGDVTDGKSSEQRATQRKRDKREVERAVRDGTETGRAGKQAKNAQHNETGRWERTGGRNYVSRPQKKTQPNNLAVTPEQT